MKSDPKISNNTVRDFIIESKILTLKGYGKIQSLYPIGFYDMINVLTGSQVNDFEPELARFREMIKSITSVKDLTKIRWNAIDSAGYARPDRVHFDPPPSLDWFGPETFHLKVKRNWFQYSSQFYLEIWWDETGAIILFDNGPCIIELLYYNVD